MLVCRFCCHPCLDGVSWDTPCRWPRKTKPTALHVPSSLLFQGLPGLGVAGFRLYHTLGFRSECWGPSGDWDWRGALRNVLAGEAVLRLWECHSSWRLLHHFFCLPQDSAEEFMRVHFSSQFLFGKKQKNKLKISYLGIFLIFYLHLLSHFHVWVLALTLLAGKAFSTCFDVWLVVCVVMACKRDMSFLLGNFSIATDFCKSFLSALQGVWSWQDKHGFLSEFFAGKVVAIFFFLKWQMLVISV